MSCHASCVLPFSSSISKELLLLVFQDISPELLVTHWPKEDVNYFLIKNESIKYWTIYLEPTVYVLPFLLADFWAALGGKKEYQNSKSLQNVVKPPRLFGCSNKTGRLTVSHRMMIRLLSPGLPCNRCGCTHLTVQLIQCHLFTLNKYKWSVWVSFCTVSQVEEVPGDFTQSDLATDDVMILDTWDQVKWAF